MPKANGYYGVTTVPMPNSESTQQIITARICHLVRKHAPIDAIYLYGSRAHGLEREDSDWDLAVLFSDFERDPVKRATRAQALEAALERELDLYNKISLIDAESVPPPLQYNAIRGHKLYDRGVLHVRKFEHGTYNRIEIDYA